MLIFKHLMFCFQAVNDRLDVWLVYWDDFFFSESVSAKNVESMHVRLCIVIAELIFNKHENQNITSVVVLGEKS